MEQVNAAANAAFTQNLCSVTKYKIARKMNTKARRKSASELNSPPFANRLLGVYPQKQDGLFMQRVKILGGRISWLQWLKITGLAQTYSQGFPLHITTRQDIELHNITAENIPAVQQGLAEVALMTFGACGDSIRNITVCAGCDLCPEGFDLLPLAQLVHQHLQQQLVIFNLPRKFKMSFSGCWQSCAKPWLSDLGFIAQHDGMFTVIGAGSLGPKPALGIQLYKDLPPVHILPLCVAAIEFFEQYGNREDRRRARFRHIREKFGDRAFKKELDIRFGRLRASQSWPDILPASGDENVKLLCRIQLPNGNITPEEAVQLARTAQLESVLRINLEHGLELYGTKAIHLPENLAAYANKPVIVACPGSSTCAKALVSSWAAADELRRTLTGHYSKNVRISISGCPNNCAHSAVANIGLVGMRRKRKGKPTECYRLFKGGDNGKNNKLAEKSDIVCAEDISNAVEHLLETRQIRQLFS